MLLLRRMRLACNQSNTSAYTHIQWLSRTAHMPKTACIKSSQITEFAQRQLVEDVIDFSAGQPGRDLLPLDLIAAAAAHRFSSSAADPFILQYGPVQGYQSFRKCLASFLTESTQHTVDPDHLIVTAGVSHGIDLAVRHLARPGDQVLVEQPTYFLAGDILRQAGVKVVPVPTIAEGLDVDALQRLLQQPDGPRPKLLYTIPIHNNPAGTTLPLHKRQQLLQLAHKYRFTVVADEVYQLLSFPDSPPPPPPMRAVERQMLQDGVLPLSKHNEGHALGSNTGSDKQVAGAHHNTGSAATAAAGCQIASEPASQGDGDAKSSIISDYLNIQLPQEDPISAASMVVSLGSFSKIMAPGLRLGWAEAPPHLLQHLMQDGVLGSGGSIAPLASGIAHSCLELGLLQQQLHNVIKPRLKRNCQALTQELRSEMPDCRFEHPLGGYFVWLDLGPKVCSQELLKLAESRYKVRFVPGKACDGMPQMARLSFAFYQPDELQEGVKRLAAALADHRNGVV